MVPQSKGHKVDARPESPLPSPGSPSEGLFFPSPVVVNASQPFQNRMAGMSRHLCVIVRHKRMGAGHGDLWKDENASSSSWPFLRVLH